MGKPRPEWWRLRPGLLGLKRYMPDRAIQYAEQHGYGWPVHYEPVCSTCPAVAALAQPQAIEREDGEC